VKFVIIIMLVVGAGAVFLLWQRSRHLSVSYDQYAGGLVPDPMAISDDDPFMKDAVAHARATVGTVRELLPSRPRNCYVKIPFQTSSGAIEHVWAGLISLDDTTITCQILSRPVHHQGDIPSPYSCSSSVLEDWQVQMPDDSIRGGYTMRVMFQRAKERYGDRMPKQLAEEMKRYVDR
jgi:uncharacterized protein YegJ (DUF2314 family)